MSVRLFARGSLPTLGVGTLGALLDRVVEGSEDVGPRVARLMARVRRDGDAALLAMALELDGAELTTIEVDRALWRTALAELDEEVERALRRAAANILRFHEALVPADVRVEVEPGVTITRRFEPLGRVGVYAPGGRAAYPSSVLMGVVPAKAAGVPEVVLCSPPGPDGLPPASVLAAAEIAGADRLFALGGAGAVAAMAWGTQTVPATQAIVGPGNRWVTEAKRQVAGEVLIDAPAGPSEVLVIADRSAEPRLVALELVAQAEHDPDACAVAVCVGTEVADAVEEALAAEVERTPQVDVVRAALAGQGAVVSTEDVDAAIRFANQYAPEHLSVMTEDAASVAARVPLAGTTFVGGAGSVAFGDYLTGANHVLPTAGLARSFSGLSTLHFLRSFTVQEIDERGAAAMADDVVRLAEAEGLPAHGAAAAARRDA